MTDISIAVGGRELPAYLAVPEGEGPWPGVVVVFEALGATGDMRAQADRFAANGYLAVLPDLYGGAPWVRCVVKAMREMRAGRGAAYEHIEAARAWLAGRDDCTGSVGGGGVCVGGGLARVAAAESGLRGPAGDAGLRAPRPR